MPEHDLRIEGEGAGVGHVLIPVEAVDLDEDLAPREGHGIDPLQDLQRLQDPVLAVHLLHDVDHARGLHGLADVHRVALRGEPRLVRLEALEQRARLPRNALAQGLDVGLAGARQGGDPFPGVADPGHLALAGLRELELMLTEASQHPATARIDPRAEAVHVPAARPPELLDGCLRLLAGCVYSRASRGREAGPVLLQAIDEAAPAGLHVRAVLQDVLGAGVAGLGHFIRGLAKARSGKGHQECQQTTGSHVRPTLPGSRIGTAHFAV